MPPSAQSSSRSLAPQSIALPPPPVFPAFNALQPPTPDESPGTAIHFYTAPSSPTTPPVQWFTPPTTPQDDAVPARLSAPQPGDLLPVSAPVRVPQAALRSPDSLPLAAAVSSDNPTDDTFPNTAIDLAADFGFSEESLTPLEKIYLYSRSESSVYRVFIAHQLPTFLDQVAPQEAIEYVLPLIDMLSMDEEEPVKEALSEELVPIIWWFFSHCQIVPDDPDSMQSFATSSTTATISVTAFTGVLANLLLSSNHLIVGFARFAVVDLLSRMSRADDREGVSPASPSHLQHKLELPAFAYTDQDEDNSYATGMFKRDERDMFRQEILQSVVIGMSRLGLDMEPEGYGSQASTPGRNGDEGSNLYSHLAVSPPAERPKSPLKSINPYFPTSTAINSASAESPATSSRQQIEARALSPPPQSHPSPTSSGPRSPSATPPPPLLRVDGLGQGGDNDSDRSHPEEEESLEDPDEEQVAIAQLSSMSLMAAVTATGLMSEDIQRAFVSEVERVGRESVHFFVRREASLALGALAKVVPEDLVTSSLLPLFDVLRWDQDRRVRHSALFALPAILPRLTPNQRRTVALETVMALSSDVSAQVQSSVLESLGEVLYTFHDDPGGPPQELIQMFLGRAKDRDVRTGKFVQMNYPWMPGFKAELSEDNFYTMPERPLVCAFNFPAVALTLGASRWHELRQVYIDLAENTNNKVRRTLAASLGEMARVLGVAHAERDLMPVWWTCIKMDDEDVRTKAIESLQSLLPGVALHTRIAILTGLINFSRDGIFRGWRERESILMLIHRFIELAGPLALDDIKDLVVRGLEDTVSAVREAGILKVPVLWNALRANPAIMWSFEDDLDNLRRSSSYKRRVTFVACMLSRFQALDGQDTKSTNSILSSVQRLVQDPVVDVRIGLARLLSAVSTTLSSGSLPNSFHLLHEQLSCDPSPEVKAYLPGIGATNAKDSTDSRPQHRSNTTFSRPPRPREKVPTERMDNINTNITTSVKVHSAGTTDKLETKINGVTDGAVKEPWVEQAVALPTIQPMVES